MEPESDVNSEATEGYDIPAGDDGHCDLDSEAVVVARHVCFKARTVRVSML